MANEITVSLSAQYTNGVDTETINRSGSTISVTTVPRAAGTALVGTSEEAIPLGDVSATGVAFFQNMDTTNPVDIYRTTGDSAPLIRLRAGQWAWVPIQGSTVFAKATTAACNLVYKIFPA